MTDKLGKRIAITGATGFLGSHLVRGLLELGYQDIVALKRESSSMDLLEDIEERIKWVAGDLLDITSVNELVKNADYVIHSAAKVSYNPSDEKEVMQSNIDGTANIVNACLDFKIEKLVFVSSVAAIGRPSKEGYINEKTEWEDSKFNTNYGLSKYMAELEVWRGMAEGLKVSVINPSMILGPSIWGDSSTKLFMHVIKGSKFYPSGSNGFVDVRDVAELTIKIMESDICNERFIAVGEHAAYKSLFDLIASNLGINPPSIALTQWMAGIISYIGNISNLLFQTVPIITKETTIISFGNFLYDNSKSVKTFSFTYRPLITSIQDTIKAYKESVAKKTNFGYFDKILK